MGTENNEVKTNLLQSKYFLHKFPISQYSRYAYTSRVDVLEVVGVDVFRGKNDYALGYLSVEVTPSIFIIMGLLLSLLSLFYHYLL